MRSRLLSKYSASMRIALANSEFCSVVGQLAKCRREFFDLAVLQPIQLAHQPALLRRLIGGIQLASQVPKMLAGMIEINDLNRAGKVLIGVVPDPV